MALARRWPWLLVLFVPLLFGFEVLYPWLAQPDGAWREAIAEPAFQRVWLSPGFFALRLVGYALAWWWLTRPAALARPRAGRAAAALIVQGVVGSLAAIDLVMSLMPLWISAGFALAVLSAQALGGAALVVLMAARARCEPVPTSPKPEPPVWRDLGNLLLMWVLLWAYLAFVQFLIVWAENLPREIVWYLPRLSGGWGAVSVALVVLLFALPLVLLLFRAIKDRPSRLGCVAAGLVGASALHAAWLVLPSIASRSAAGWWLVPTLMIAMGLVMLAGLPASLREQGVEAPAERWRHAHP
jgi:hypothetical protein